MYGIETKVLKQAVRRNINRFPGDFMFVLTPEELKILRSQFVTSKSDPRGGTRYTPMAFTEQGVAMLSSVLNSPRAIEVNIAIMRTFFKLRRMMASHAELASKLAALEKKYDEQFKVVFEVLAELMAPPQPKKKQIGFHVREKMTSYRAVRGRKVSKKVQKGKR